MTAPSACVFCSALACRPPPALRLWTPRGDLRFLDGAGSVYATACDLLNFIQSIRVGAFGSARDHYDRNSTDWAGKIAGEIRSKATVKRSAGFSPDGAESVRGDPIAPPVR